MAGTEIKPLDGLDAVARKHFADVGPVDEYRRDIQKGLMPVFAVFFDGDRVGSFGLRIESSPLGFRQMVCVAGFADYPKACLARPVLEHIENMARGAGIWSLCIQTKRPGWAGLLTRMGREIQTVWEI